MFPKAKKSTAFIVCHGILENKLFCEGRLPSEAQVNSYTYRTNYQEITGKPIPKRGGGESTTRSPSWVLLNYF